MNSYEAANEHRLEGATRSQTIPQWTAELLARIEALEAQMRELEGLSHVPTFAERPIPPPDDLLAACDAVDVEEHGTTVKVPNAPRQHNITTGNHAEPQ